MTQGLEPKLALTAAGVIRKRNDNTCNITNNNYNNGVCKYFDKRWLIKC